MNPRDEQTLLFERGTGRLAEMVTVRIPSDVRLIEAALELRTCSAGRISTYGVHSDRCVGRYLPPRPSSTTIVDPFTGDRGETRLGELGEDCTFFHYDGDLTAVAVVLFGTSPPTVRLLGKPLPTEQLSLFGASEPESRFEGTPRIAQQTFYERDPRLRASCLAHHGVVCVVCGMTFEAVYGVAAAGVIHVHHLEPLADVGRAHEVDPVKDLVPVCPNCHAVIHVRTPPLTPLEAKTLMSGVGVRR